MVEAEDHGGDREVPSAEQRNQRGNPVIGDLARRTWDAKQLLGDVVRLPYFERPEDAVSYPDREAEQAPCRGLKIGHLGVLSG